MSSSRVITYIREGVLADALYEDGKLLELSLIPDGRVSLLGNIYVGKIKNIVENIQAAFVEIEGGVLCYLPLSDMGEPIRVSPSAGSLKEGDELLVQVNREAVKTKGPSVTTNLNLAGKYLVLTTGNREIGCSAKLPEGERRRLRELAAAWEPEDDGLILRTNAAGASGEELRTEYERLLGISRFLRQQAVHRSVYSCVYRSRPAYLTSILGSRSGTIGEIVTDAPEIYGEIGQFLREEMPEDAEKLRLYQDRMQPLRALYRLEKELHDALSPRVWLKSGAYLVIEATEAFTVIDVNTGKYTGKKNRQETFRRINEEAAREIARQLRLRNLSGIILIDFVDMDDREEAERLLTLMRKLLSADPQKADAVDVTKLWLMELTRKKQKKTLAEQAKECGI